MPENRQGVNTHDALIQTNHARLRPILMTTFDDFQDDLPIAKKSEQELR